MLRKTILILIINILFLYSFVWGGVDSIAFIPDGVSESLSSVSTIIDYNNVWAAYNNQANLFFLKQRGIGVSYRLISDLFNVFNAAFAEPLESGTVGFVLSYADFGTLDFVSGIDTAGTSLNGDTYQANDIIISAGYGSEYNGLLYGVGIKYCNNKIADSTETTFSADLNLIKNLGSVILGISAKNIVFNNNLTMPTFVAAGITYPVLIKKSKNSTLNIIGEFRYYIEKDYAADEYNGVEGVQYVLGNFLLNISGNIYNNADPVSFGSFGMSYVLPFPSVKIDYAVNTLNKDIGVNHTLSVSYFFQNFHKEDLKKNSSLMNIDDKLKEKSKIAETKEEKEEKNKIKENRKKSIDSSEKKEVKKNSDNKKSDKSKKRTEKKVEDSDDEWED